jgi:hypothetical protein
MTNITLSVDQEVLKQACILALQQGTSVNAVICDFLKTILLAISVTSRKLSIFLNKPNALNLIVMVENGSERAV